MFVLLDEQRDAYEHVLHAVDRARRSDTKRAVVVSGGPGSGKSVIALSLMGELSRQGRSVVHATASRSFTQTLRRVAGARAPRAQKLFKYFNSFMTAEPNDLDCLILDEVHRIRETSVNRCTRKEQRDQARPQIHELLTAARVPVFLLDATGWSWDSPRSRPSTRRQSSSRPTTPRATGSDDHSVVLGGAMNTEVWTQRIREFAQERDWEQFHTPKNLAMALSVEASELVEIFQWMTPEQAAEVMSNDKARAVQDEVAGILTYLLRFADVLGIDLDAALTAKAKSNALRYPTDEFKGSPRQAGALILEAMSPVPASVLDPLRRDLDAVPIADVAGLALAVDAPH